ncbi:MAG: 50S ribosomal protein L4 [Clostridiales bacterium]|jgi:large subunit ribosomal protein L4|nr:50S ribosomal protein L4 [Clostridiales bacterium]MDR2749774.1 50S ribosomal protein L4 [Clostridiales bacterium]
MASVDVYNMNGDKLETLELPDSIFGVEVNEHAVHMSVVQYLANQRVGTKSAKTRAEVRGGGRKPYKQKGTGRARQGSIRAPQWTGGGVVFAPKPRDFSIRLNKKQKRLALKSVLTEKVREKKFIVLDELKLSGAKTKEMKKVCDNLKLTGKALVVINGSDRNVILSARNMPLVTTAAVNTINVYDIINHDTFVATREAVQKITEVYV